MIARLAIRRERTLTVGNSESNAATSLAFCKKAILMLCNSITLEIVLMSLDKKNCQSVLIIIRADIGSVKRQF
jgi:hypothetical protein